MKKALIALVAVAVILGIAAVVATVRPSQRPASLEKVARTPAQLARGEYLVRHVLACNECHTARDWTRWGGPASGPAGAGGDCYNQDHGFPGTICGSNVTPDPATGIGAWTDGEVLRAIREGVDREGQALFPLMPYTEYRHLSDEDARAVVAFVRGLQPVRHAVRETEIDFPVSFFMRMAPRPLDGPVLEPNPSDPVHYGEYLATVAGCKFCHTPVDGRNQPIEGRAFGGGQEFRGPWGTVVSSNLTPHPTGLGQRNQENFVSLFRSFADVSKVAVPTRPGENTVMPWFAYSGMTDFDLGAIYTYLRTVKPVDSVVEKYPDREESPQP